jgi:hypothetical protein
VSTKRNNDADKIEEQLKEHDGRTIAYLAGYLGRGNRYVHNIVTQMPGFHVSKDARTVGNYTVRLAAKPPPAPTGTPDRVTIEITPKGYKTTVFAGNVVCSEREMVRDRPGGGSRATQLGRVQDDLPDFDNLAEAIDDHDPFRIMIELDNINPVDGHLR